MEAFKGIRDVEDSYSHVKSELISWFDGMKEIRRKRARTRFEKMAYSSSESLYLYSTKLEKMFRKAYPKKDCDRSSVLREKFLFTIPSSMRKQLESQVLLSDQMNDRVTSWKTIQKFDKCKDEHKHCKEEVSDDAKEIVINMSKVKDAEKKCERIPVFFNSKTKEFVIQDSDDNIGFKNLIGTT